MPTVLVIEDQHETVALIKAILATRNIDMVAVERAQAGIDLIQSNPPDVVIMDLLLPGMDGFTAIEIIKTDDSTKHIPVIAITAASIANSHERLRKAGADAFVAKPFKIPELLGAIERFLK